MPLLLVDGRVQGHAPMPPCAGPCEWCGLELTREQCRPVGAVFDGEWPFVHDRIAVVTRMCQECIGIYSRLGTDHLAE